MEDNINTNGVSQTLQNEFEEYIQKDLQDCVREMRTQKWQLFLDEKIKTWTTQVMNLKISLPNAKNKQPYHQLVPLDVDGIFIKNASILNDSFLILHDRILLFVVFNAQPEQPWHGELTSFNDWYAR